MKKYLAIVNSELITPARMGIQGADLRHPVETFLKVFRHFASDSLYRNSIYLMLSTAVMAFFGFFFWIIVARLYTPEQVGIATTLISVMSLIASFSILGLNVGLVRFLPSSKNKNELINSSFFVTTLTAVVISVIFLAGISFFSPTLLFLQKNIMYSFIFIISIIALSNNTIIDSLFVAYRSAKYSLVKNTTFSITKLILPVLLISFAAYGIFLATGLAYIFTFIISVFILSKSFSYKINIMQNLSELRKISLYSFGNYIAGFLNMLPTLLLPIIIINELGAEKTAYFYIALMVANFIFMIPMATTQSLFAEGANDEAKLREHIMKAAKITGLIIFPAILFILFFGNYILHAFGNKYSSEAFHLLQLLAVSGIFMATNSISGTILKVKNKIKELVAISVFSAILILLLSYLFLNMGLYGAGIAWILGQAVVSITYIILIKIR